MAKKAMREAVVEAVAEVVLEEPPYIWVEEPNGGEPYRVDVPEEVGRERLVTVGGVRYEHCADMPDGRWVYRRMAK